MQPLVEKFHFREKENYVPDPVPTEICRNIPVDFIGIGSGPV